MILLKSYKKFDDLAALAEDIEDEDFDDKLFDFPISTSPVKTTSFGFVYVDYNELQDKIKTNYEVKKSTFIGGPPGLGKSAIMETVAKQIASTLTNEQGTPLKYINFKQINHDNLDEIVRNITDYFIFMDLRTSTMEPSDMQGIPDIRGERKFLEFKMPIWAYLCTRPKSHGFLFFDEINQGNKSVLDTLYSIVNDEERKIGSPPVSLGEGWGVFAAGNVGSQYQTERMQLALINRFANYYLEPDPDSWIEWARQNGIYKHIIGFISSNPSENFYEEPTSAEERQFPSPRQFVALSRLIKHRIKKALEYLQATGKHVDIYKAIQQDAGGLCGTSWASRFRIYLEKTHDLSLEKIVSGKLLSRNANKRFNQEDAYTYIQFVTDKVVEAFRKVESKPTPELEAKLKQTLDLYIKIHNMIDDQDLIAVLYTKIKKILEERFVKMILKYVKTDPEYAAFLKKYQELGAMRDEYNSLKGGMNIK